jgi:hypothetical protein
MGMFLFLSSFDGYTPQECFFRLEHSTNRRYKWVWAHVSRIDSSATIPSVNALGYNVERGTVEVCQFCLMVGCTWVLIEVVDDSVASK